jgi:ATP-binding cassette subfamily B protein
MKAIGASERVFELMDREPKVQGGTLDIGDATGRIDFENVNFAYPTRLDIPVLIGFSLTIEAGEVVALVGPSGGGKSTVAALLSRLYDPCDGTIKFDDKDVTALKIDQVRELVGVVSQEPLLFATTVEDNIRYGDLNATYEQVKQAAIAANAHDFISKFPDGYDTMVGERGIKLSGGQKQRVAIARAILKNPKVLVLDEATSALDAESEHLVQEALERLMVGRTTIIIAHRLSTVKEADRVCVLNDGKIVQSGRHNELVASDGLYKRLVERQFA